MQYTYTHVYRNTHTSDVRDLSKKCNQKENDFEGNPATDGVSLEPQCEDKRPNRFQSFNRNTPFHLEQQNVILQIT